MALLTADIIDTVSRLRRNGVEFLHVPDSYYEELPGRVGPVKETIESLRPLGILVDRDQDGYLLQIFTQPVEDRPTLFFELIQREGSRGFGKAISKRCSSRSSGSRRSVAICNYADLPPSGRDPTQTPQRLPQERWRPLRRGVDGQQGLHRPVFPALSLLSTDPDQIAAPSHGSEVGGRSIAPTRSSGISRQPACRHLQRSARPDSAAVQYDLAALFAQPQAEDAFFYRNGQGDELIYVSDGEGVLETQFGDLPFRRGDYLVIPRGVVHRYRYTAQPVRFLILESAGTSTISTRRITTC